jgi:excisionase family DNA binding protein
MGQDNQLLLVIEVAERLRCSRTMVYDLIANGELPAIRRGRYIRIPAWAVTAWEDRNLQGGDHGKATRAR